MRYYPTPYWYIGRLGLTYVVLLTFGTLTGLEIGRTQLINYLFSHSSFQSNRSSFDAVITMVTLAWLDLEERDTMSLDGTPPWVGGFASLFLPALSEVC